MKQALFASALSALAMSGAYAQTAPTRIGILGGVNFADFGGDTTQMFDARFGSLSGITLVKPLSRSLSLEVNGLFSMKGATLEEELGVVTFKNSYIEAPILLRYEFPTTGTVKPHLAAGVSVGYQISCSVSGSGGGISTSLDCDDLENDPDLGFGRFNRFEAAGVIGGGIDFISATRTFTLGARYSLGLTDLAAARGVTNRVIALYAGLSIPLGR